jgi:hypothetical protein
MPNYYPIIRFGIVCSGWAHLGFQHAGRNCRASLGRARHVPVSERSVSVPGVPNGRLRDATSWLWV